MKCEDIITKVLALFDDEDIKYIKVDIVQKYISKKNSEKIKKIGEKNGTNRR